MQESDFHWQASVTEVEIEGKLYKMRLKIREERSWPYRPLDYINMLHLCSKSISKTIEDIYRF